MAKLDRNLDAYRTCAEAMVRLRRFLRQQLNGGDPADNGSTWVPDELRAHLVQRQEREQGIHWGLGESCDLLDFAGFTNLFEIIAANDHLVQLFSSLAPDVNLLRSRFLEMDTAFNRVAFVRPVSESELEFLTSFDERLRRVMSSVETDVPRVEPGKTAAAKNQPLPKAPQRHSAASASQAAKATSRAPEPPSVPAAKPHADRSIEPSRRDIAQLIAEDDKVGILKALYQEITGIADGMWGTGTPPVPRNWEHVRESDWYRVNFVPLGLKPVSDFYDVAETSREMLLSGTSRNQIQDFLRERNFAQLLLSLRDMFRKNLATDGGSP